MKEPYVFSENDLSKYAGLEKKSSITKEKCGIPSHINPDSKIKNYTVISLIGEGSYSSVWNVYNKDKNDLYAIKMTKPNNDDEKVAQNEINILKKLNQNDYIIKLHSSFYYKNNNSKYLCMCFDKLGCDLHVLKRLFKYKCDYYNSSDENSSEISFNDPIIAIPFKLAKKITYQILKGLEYMHNNNIIHTDLKLDNILIDKNILDIKYDTDINIKICDFGTSHHTKDKCDYNIGTIDYSAPECIIGLPYGKGIDIWATGCILFELITGICLFDYSRYYEDASEYSSGFSSSSFEDENDKTQIEFLLLCMMKKIIGNFPSKIFKKAKYYDNYFDNKGRLRFFPLFLEETDLLTSLLNEFNYQKKDAESLNEILSHFLDINPNTRKNVKYLLEHPWFEDKSN